MRKAIIAAALLALGAALALAENPPPVKPDLERYFAVRAALAADQVEAAKEAAAALRGAGDERVAEPARRIAEAPDLKAARLAFGDLTKALLPLVEEAARRGEDLGGTVYVFECPMAEPYGKWMQAEPDLANPYYGARMLKCGRKVAEIKKA